MSHFTTCLFYTERLKKCPTEKAHPVTLHSMRWSFVALGTTLECEVHTDNCADSPLCRYTKDLNDDRADM